MGKYQQCPAELPRRQGAMSVMYMAPADHESEKWPDFYAERVDDESGYAIRAASSGTARRVYDISNGGPRRRTEGPSADVGPL